MEKHIFRSIIPVGCHTIEPPRVSVLNRRSHFGFGQKVYHGRAKLPDDFYGEWEVGTYNCPWRVVQNGQIICGSNDTGSTEELNAALNRITIGRIISLTKDASSLNIRAEFDEGIVVDFLPTMSTDDECFHVFCPGNTVVTFDAVNHWLIGESNRPWKTPNKATNAGSNYGEND